jgi:hypothetical protein
MNATKRRDVIASFMIYMGRCLYVLVLVLEGQSVDEEINEML